MAKQKTDRRTLPVAWLKGRRMLVMICLALLIGSTYLLVRNESWRFVNPFGSFPVENVSNATVDPEGNTYVIVASGEEILKISAEGALVRRYIGADCDFSGATHIAYGGDGALYVHLVHYSEGVRIDGEEVIALSPEGERRVVVSKTRERDAMRQSIFSPMGTDDGALFFILGEGGLCVFDQDNRVIRRYDPTELMNYIISVAYDAGSGALYYSTYDGKLVRNAGDRTNEVLYDCREQAGSNPQDVGWRDGRLYCADVGLRDVIVYDRETEAISRCAIDAEFDLRPITPVISGAEGGVVITSESGVYRLEGAAFEEMEAPTLAPVYVRTALLTWAAIVLFFLSLAVLLLLGIIRIVGNSNTTTQITISIILVVAGIGALFLGLLFPSFQQQFENELYLREQFAAKVTLQKIDRKSLERVTGPADYMGEAYLDIKSAADDIFMSGEADEMYCMIYRQLGDSVYIIYTLEDLYAAYPSDYTPEDLEEFETGAFARLKSSTSQGNYLYVQLPITDDEDRVVGFVEVGTEITEIDEAQGALLQNLIINMLAMTVVLILLALELISFISGKRRFDAELFRVDGARNLPPELFRFIVFLVFFFTNLTCAILPIYATKIAGSLTLFGISSEVLAAIPISAEVFSGAVFSAIGSRIIRRLGSAKAVILSSLCFTAGLAVRIVPNLWTLTLGSLVLGMGWGIQLLMVNVQIAKLPEKEKDMGYAYYNIASLAGANSAVVLGGFLVQWVSYPVLFAITAFSSVVLFIVSNRYLASDDGTEADAAEPAEAEKSMPPIRFVFHPRVIGFFAFMLVPFLISGYFLYYMFPIVGSEWGLSDTYIGYAYVLNGMFAVLLGKVTTEFFSCGKRKPVGLVLAMAMYAGAFFLVARQLSVLSLLIALVILGIADSFGIPLLTNYYTDLKPVEAYGYDRALGVYSLFENGAQSLGSFVFGIILTVGVARGLRTMIAVLGILAVCFLASVALCGRKERKSRG